MWEWHIAYEGDQRAEERKIGPRAYETTKELFRAAADAGQLDGRAVSAMWVIDLDSEQEDVILLHGRAPADIHARYHAYRQRAGAGERKPATKKPRR
jgi:hypothetical protein